ncbi:MAG: GTPase HflX, partial [Oscillospiraceae bacterium]|nr:GTPase HflX [Oscillospiraceae bacterium]
MNNNQIKENTPEETTQRVLLAGLDLGEDDFEISLDELRELTETAGGEVVGVLTQKRPAPEKGTYVGAGRLAEITEFCKANDIDMIIFDAELSSIQIKNIGEAAGVRVIDRTMLILDIFAARAKTAEGKLQVELAQLRYMLPRLTGKGIELSRLGGGIGTRGPGETKLETDRRHIRRRIEHISEKMDEVDERRERVRARRRKTGVVTAAIVGYTNAGKSTLLNCLTGAGVLTENRLFATLDPTARALILPSGA